MSYTATTWSAGDTVTASKLNKLEQGVSSINDGPISVVITRETSGNTEVMTCDKTASMIYNAMLNGGGVHAIVAEDKSNYTGYIVYRDISFSTDGTDLEFCLYDVENDEKLIFYAATGNDYPVLAEGRA